MGTAAGVSWLAVAGWQWQGGAAAGRGGGGSTRRALKAVTWPKFWSTLRTWRDSVTFFGGGERRSVTARVESWVTVRDIEGSPGGIEEARHALRTVLEWTVTAFTRTVQP